MPIREIDQIKGRYLFYRYNYGRAVMVMLFFLTVVLLQLFAIAYLIVFEPEPRYFASSYNGLLYGLQSFEEPNFAASALNEWAS